LTEYFCFLRRPVFFPCRYFLIRRIEYLLHECFLFGVKRNFISGVNFCFMRGCWEGVVERADFVHQPFWRRAAARPNTPARDFFYLVLRPSSSLRGLQGEGFVNLIDSFLPDIFFERRERTVRRIHISRFPCFYFVETNA